MIKTFSIISYRNIKKTIIPNDKHLYMVRASMFFHITNDFAKGEEDQLLGMGRQMNGISNGLKIKREIRPARNRFGMFSQKVG